MGITLYTAPDCLRCRIVKAFLADKNISYESADFKEQKDVFNAFYRAQRPSIYRNPEGVEFPLFYDGEVVKQGSGEIIAYLLSGHALEGSVTRSDLLHGWISGLYPSLCPVGQEENYIELLGYLADGLQVCIQTDGRRPEFVEKLLQTGKVSRLIFNLLGSPTLYEEAFGGPIEKDAIVKTVALVEGFTGAEMRLLISPIKRQDGTVSWLTKEEAAEAAQFLAESTERPTLPLLLDAVTATMPQGLQGLEPFDQFLPYRSAVRNYQFKTDIAKQS